MLIKRLALKDISIENVSIQVTNHAGNLKFEYIKLFRRYLIAI